MSTSLDNANIIGYDNIMFTKILALTIGFTNFKFILFKSTLWLFCYL